jgi:hypothetical protein
MNNFITKHSDWIEEYKKDTYKIWIRATLSDGIEVYLPEHSDWIRLKEVCKNSSLGIMKVGLQYKSHFVETNTEDTDGVYLIRSLLSSMGGDAKETVTIGKIYGDVVEKSIWVTPELVKEIEEKDTIESCFEEAIIYHYGKQ